MEVEPGQTPQAGWYALLDGEAVDLADWCDSLNAPFDPVAFKFADGRVVLRSKDFEGLTGAEAIRARALVLISRINGALALWNGTRTVRFGGILRVDGDGRQHITVYAEMAAIEMGRCAMRATAVVLGPNGKPLPPPPPQPSQLQIWNEIADENDDVSDLLDQFGRADNWYDIYKTIEIAAYIAGGKHRLWKVLQAEVKACKALVQTANFYRHARGVDRPQEPVSLADAKPLLAWIVRTLLDTRRRAGT